MVIEKPKVYISSVALVFQSTSLEIHGFVRSNGETKFRNGEIFRNTGNVRLVLFWDCIFCIKVNVVNAFEFYACLY